RCSMLTRTSRRAAVSRLSSSTLFVDFLCSATPTSYIYTLSLHDALPISLERQPGGNGRSGQTGRRIIDGAGIPSPTRPKRGPAPDRKSTRLNSSHVKISYAVFCLKKKNERIGKTGEPHLCPHARH